MLYLFLVEEVSTFFAQICMPYYVVYATEILSIERTQWSMLLTLQSAVTFCSLLPVGKIIDAFGRKKMLVMVHLTVAVAMLLFIYGDLTKLAMFFVLSGICNSMLVAYQSLEADLVPRGIGERCGVPCSFSQPSQPLLDSCWAASSTSTYLREHLFSYY